MSQQPLRGGASLAVTILCGLLFLTFLDNTIVAVGLSSIQHTMHGSITSLQWTINGYALAFAALMLPAGVISDEFGRKRVMLGGIAVFCVGSVICATAGHPPQLLTGRVVMGVGAAASEPGTLSMLRQMFPDDPMRSRVFGIWAAVSALALALGPVLGGALIGLAGWRLIFWTGLAIGGALLVAAALVLPESSDPQADRLDLPGALLGIAALALIVDGVIRAELFGYGSSGVVARLAIGAVCAVGFVIRQRRATQPLINLTGVDRVTFAVANVAAFTTYFAIFSVFLFTALYLQQVSGYDGYRIAAQFLPLTVGMLAAALVAGVWAGRRGGWEVMITGCVCFGTGLLLVTAVIAPHSNAAELTAALALVGIGIGLTVVPITTAALGAVPAERSGLAASATNTSRELGAVAGVAVLGAVVTSRLAGDLQVSFHRLGIPAFVQRILIAAIERSGSNAYQNVAADHSTIAREVVVAAHDAFGDALHVALVTSVILVFATALLLLVASRRR